MGVALAALPGIRACPITGVASEIVRIDNSAGIVVPTLRGETREGMTSGGDRDRTGGGVRGDGKFK